MAARFTDYREAHNYAVGLAIRLGREVGIEAAKEYGKPGFNVHHLPRPEHRFGYELRVEVVGPNDPLTLAKPT